MLPDTHFYVHAEDGRKKGVTPGLDLVSFFYYYFQTDDGQILWDQMEHGVIYKHGLVLSILEEMQKQGHWPAQLTEVRASEVRVHSTVYVVKPLISGLHALVSVLDGPWMIIPKERGVTPDNFRHLAWVEANIGRMYTGGQRPSYDIGDGLIQQDLVRISPEDEVNLITRVYLGNVVQGILNMLPARRDILPNLTEVAANITVRDATPGAGSILNN